MKATSLIAAIASASLMFGACSSRPDYVLDENKMAEVLADLGIADQLSLRALRGQNEFDTDSARKVLRQAIMKHNGVTEAQFDSTLNWYGHHMDDYAKLYKKVENRLADRRTTLNRNAGTGTDDADNIWPLPAMISIGERDAYPGFSFSIPGSSIDPGKTLVWRFRMTRMKDSATVFMAAEYPDMEMLHTRRTINGDGSTELRLVLEKGRRPLRVTGYMHFPNQLRQRVWIDSLSLTQERRTISDKPAGQSVISPLHR